MKELKLLYYDLDFYQKFHICKFLIVLSESQSYKKNYEPDVFYKIAVTKTFEQFPRKNLRHITFSIKLQAASM